MPARLRPTSARLRPTSARRAAATLAAGLLLVACSSGSGTASGSGNAQGTTTPPSTTARAPTTAPPDTTAPPTTASAADFAAVRLRLAKVAAVEQPVAMAAPAGDTALYVAEKTGRVRAIRKGRVDPAPVLDLSSEVSGGGEQGLLGLAFSPDRRFLYVYYTDLHGDVRVVEFAMRGGRADPRSRRQLFQVEHSQFSNHNGGQLVMTGDGALWAGIGDGGGGGDPFGSGQSLTTMLGKIVRITPRPSGGRPYGIPRGNPLVGRAGARPEIWAYGLRNPWRFSFDPANGDLWIGDVGQGTWEEIDHEPGGSGGGRNYGWNRREGAHPFAGGSRSGLVDPVLEYDHSGGACSVTGGYVYRGSRAPGLRGAYVYGDYCAGWIRGVRLRGGAVADRRDFGLNLPGLSSFGVDQSGELYALSLNGGVYRLT
ncbi:MAG TPA: PQQ-dependent sugar dehydrogenase [Actinomycetes bacterium]|jgi:glucose/arabinose dehydrogenase|nr:PQQ-dependent sugar dehydrogenase [Actinomycetes bacterium]